MAALTLEDIRDDIMPYCGHTVWTNVPAATKKRIARDLNQSLQDIRIHGPPWANKQERNARIYGPRNLTGKTIAQYASQFTADTGTAVDSSHLGCTCYLTSSSVASTLKTVDSAGVGAEIREPNMGPAVTVGTVVVESDAILIPSDVFRVGVVWLPNIARSRYVMLKEISSRDEYEYLRQAPPYRLDLPERYWIEVYGPQRFLRLWPFPAAEMLLKYEAYLRPDTVTVTQIDTGTLVLDILGEATESILLPILRHRFSTWPTFNADEDKAELFRDRQLAMQKLREMNPQTKLDDRLTRPRGW